MNILNNVQRIKQLDQVPLTLILTNMNNENILKDMSILEMEDKVSSNQHISKTESRELFLANIVT